MLFSFFSLYLFSWAEWLCIFMYLFMIPFWSRCYGLTENEMYFIILLMFAFVMLKAMLSSLLLLNVLDRSRWRYKLYMYINNKYWKKRQFSNVSKNEALSLRVMTWALSILWAIICHKSPNDVQTMSERCQLFFVIFLSIDKILSWMSNVHTHQQSADFEIGAKQMGA